jgi:acyl carrier protein
LTLRGGSSGVPAEGDDLREDLLARCRAQGLFADGAPIDCDADLLESGMIDSMGLMALQAVAEETYGVYIPQAVFIAELRTLAKVAAYLDGKVSPAAWARARQDDSTTGEP